METACTTNEHEMEHLQQSLEEARIHLSEARETIARLEAENAALRRQTAEVAAANSRNNNSVGYKNGQADEDEVGEGMAQPQDTAATGPQSAASGQDGDANEEKKDEDANGDSNVAATGISSAMPDEGTNKIEKKEADDNAPTQDTDQIAQNGRKDDQDDASVDSADDIESESESDNDEEDSNNDKEEAPTSPADDIRLRAARTLIWADSAIKRAEALKEQQASSSQLASAASDGPTFVRLGVVVG